MDMASRITGDCRPLLIGSMPLEDHIEASRLVAAYTPDIPVWVQLPKLKGEGMVEQFLPGMPGLVMSDNRFFVNTDDPDFDQALLAFYENYLALDDASSGALEAFALPLETTGGLFQFETVLEQREKPPVAVKGQVTGPITFTTALKDQADQAVFYNPQIRDAAVKLLAARAAWQVDRFKRFNAPVIIFIDEPALAGFGSSEFISMTRENVAAALEEVIAAIHSAGGLAGIHVCANTDWSLILDTTVDVVNFDAYAYFDRFILYAEQVKAFFDSGRLLAWGLIPTLEPSDILRETIDSLYRRFEQAVDGLTAIGLSPQQIRAQSMLTPSCGLGSLTPDLARRVLELTRDLSAALQAK
jgi:methionine synthase II (cobalamin-independent)